VRNQKVTMAYAPSVLTDAILAHAILKALSRTCVMVLLSLTPTTTTATAPLLRPTVMTTMLPVPNVGLMLMCSMEPADVTVDILAHQMHAV